MFRKLTIVSLMGLCAGCSTANPKNNPTPPVQPGALEGDLTLKDSSLEIAYFQGHAAHRILAWVNPRRPDLITAQFFLDRALIKQTEILKTHYGELIAKTSNLLNKIQARGTSGSTSDAQCRAPYRISLKVGTVLRISNGCRANDNCPDLNHLVRDAEFLMYSKK